MEDSVWRCESVVGAVRVGVQVFRGRGISAGEGVGGGDWWGQPKVARTTTVDPGDGRRLK
jgi:hypothetical protein